MSEVQSMTVPVEVAPRLADGVTTDDVFVSWIRRAQHAPLMKPRGDAYVNVRVPLLELQAILTQVDNDAICGNFEEAISRAGGLDLGILPQPLKRPRKAKATD